MSYAVVMPYRGSSTRTSRVVELCVSAWLEMPLVSSVILVDSSNTPLSFDNEKIDVIHRPYSGKFNLAFMRNVGLRHAIDSGIEHVQIMDTDIFPSSDLYSKKCLGLMTLCDMVKPYVLNSPSEVPDRMSFKDKQYQGFLNVDLDKCKRKVFSYSTIFMKTKIAAVLHGHDEAYETWGSEDDDFMIRAQRAGFKVRQLPKPELIHSWHEEDTKIEAKNNTDQYDKNYKRFKLTMAGKLPQIRMPEDWGLCSQPRTGQ